MALLGTIGRRCSRAGVLLALSLLLIGAQGRPGEFDVKAVYLVKFVQFVDWPDDSFSKPDSPLVIGVLGMDRFGEVLDKVSAGEMVKEHPLQIRRFHNIKDVDNVQVLFIDSSEMSRIRSILNALKGKRVLTVSDIDSFSRDGGIVRFLTEKNKVHFRINVDAAKRAGLQISSKLLQLAEIVHDNDQ